MSLLILRGPQPVRKKFKDGRPRPGMTNHLNALQASKYGACKRFSVFANACQ